MELGAEVLSGDTLLATDTNLTKRLLLVDEGVPLLLEDFGIGSAFNASGVNLSGNVQLSDLLLAESDAEFHRIISILHVYVLPIIILIGIVGNTISFLVYVSTPRLYRQSSSLYLAFLAAVDNISLIFIFAVWFGWIKIRIFYNNSSYQERRARRIDPHEDKKCGGTNHLSPSRSLRQYLLSFHCFSMVWVDRDPHFPQERLVPDDPVLHVRVQLPVGVDCGELHGGEVDRRVSPSEASPSVYAPPGHHSHGVADRHLLSVLFVFSVHD